MGENICKSYMWQGNQYPELKNPFQQ
jgi:hypothetical protein